MDGKNYPNSYLVIVNEERIRMINKPSRATTRIKRHKRIRNHVSGTSERPRLAVFRSNKNIYVQAIDDTAGNTLASASTVEKSLAGSLNKKSDKEAAAAVGTSIAKKLNKMGIKEVIFDRGGYLYHGKIKALADAAREAGLQF